MFAKPSSLNINLSSDRFSMFNKERDIFLGAAFGVLIFLHGASIGISNVLFVARKLHAIEKLISVKPERTG